MTTPTYPPCALTEDYPILLAIPPEERAAWVAQAERAEALSAEQLAALGLWTGFKDVVLLPQSGKGTTPAQLKRLFPNQHVLLEILALAKRR